MVVLVGKGVEAGWCDGYRALAVTVFGERPRTRGGNPVGDLSRGQTNELGWLRGNRCPAPQGTGQQQHETGTKDG